MSKETIAAKPKEKSDFNRGHLMALYEVITLMQQQAIAFGINNRDIGLEGINPDADLLS